MVWEVHIENKLLTIAIPTYNRAACLDLCLSSIAGEITGRENEIELIVSDNCSPDSTESVVQNFISRGLPITYIRNIENLGADRNVQQCFNRATGRYVLIIGDDDVLLPGSMNRILSTLEEKDYGVVYIRSYAFWNDHIRERPRIKKWRFGMREFNDYQRFSSEIHSMLTFLSGNIVQKRYAEGVNFEDYIGTNLNHMAWVLRAMTSAPSNAIIDNFLIAAKVGNSGGYKFCTVFAKNLASICTSLARNEREKQAFEAILRQMLRVYYPEVILQLRQNQGRFEEEDRLQIMSSLFQTFPAYWYSTWPSLVFPLPAARFWYWFTRKILKFCGVR